jgi:hypothetical protein
LGNFFTAVSFRMSIHPKAPRGMENCGCRQPRSIGNALRNKAWDSTNPIT